MQKESAVRLASAAMPSVDENGEVTVPSTISKDHRELFARAQRWVSMSDEDIQVRQRILLWIRSPVCRLCRESERGPHAAATVLNVRVYVLACSGEDERNSRRPNVTQSVGGGERTSAVGASMKATLHRREVVEEQGGQEEQGEERGGSSRTHPLFHRSTLPD
jgi:hypothetical protein